LGKGNREIKQSCGERGIGKRKRMIELLEIPCSYKKKRDLEKIEERTIKGE